jgi:hypothetical protein
MSSLSALQHALGGIQSNLRGLQRSAHELATANAAEPRELAAPLVHAIEQQRGLEASANVMRRVDEVLGNLIDTFA